MTLDLEGILEIREHRVRNGSFACGGGEKGCECPFASCEKSHAGPHLKYRKSIFL